MKRREFLKGVMGAGALVAVPSLVNAGQAYDPSTDPFVKSLGEGIQEGLDILDSIEYKELESHGELTEKAIEDAILDIKRFEDEKGVTIGIAGKEPTREQLYFQEAINSVP